MTPNTQLRALLDRAERRYERARVDAEQPIVKPVPVKTRDVETGRDRTVRLRPFVPEERPSERKVRMAAIQGLARRADEARPEILSDFDRLSALLEQAQRR